MNKLMSKLSPSATRLIRGDHAYVMAQFHKVQPGASRLVSDAAVRNLCNALEVHAILTGGLAAAPWARGVDGVDAIDPDLTLKGLAILHAEASGGDRSSWGWDDGRG